MRHTIEIYAIKINGLNDPVGFDFEPLLCSWKVRGNTGTKQQWAKIQIASDKALPDILWEKEGDLNSLGEMLDLPLKPYTRYYYQIYILIPTFILLIIIIQIIYTIIII